MGAGSAGAGVGEDDPGYIGRVQPLPWQHSKHFVRLRFYFLAVDAYRAFQLRLVAIELNLNVVNQRSAATSTVPLMTGEMLCKLTFTVDDGHPAIRQLE